MSHTPTTSTNPIVRFGDYIRRIFTGAASLVTGMRVTTGYLFDRSRVGHPL